MPRLLAHVSACTHLLRKPLLSKLADAIVVNVANPVPHSVLTRVPHFVIPTAKLDARALLVAVYLNQLQRGFPACVLEGEASW